MPVPPVSAAAAVVEGVVEDSAGGDLEGIRVSAFTTAPGGVGGGTFTDATGRYSLALAPGSYMVEFMDPSGTFLYECRPIASPGCGQTTYSDGTTTALDIVMYRPGSVSGTVTSAIGGAVTPATVEVRSPRFIGTAPVAANGTYSIAGVPPGTYVARVVTAPFPLVPEYYRDTYNAAFATPVSVNETADTPNIDYLLVARSTGVVHVRNGSGVGIGGAPIAVCQAPATFVGSACTSGPGVIFAFANASGDATLSLPPGHFTLTTGAGFTAYAPSIDLAPAPGQPFECTFVIVAGAVDPSSGCPDDDGVTNAVEAGAPNFGDGNSDGIPDAHQPHVTSLPAASGGGYVTVATAKGTLAAVTVAALPSTPPPGAVALDPGLIGYTVEGLTFGASVDVAIHLSQPTTATGYAKYVGGAWQSLLPDEFTIDPSGTKVTLHLVDGGTGDADGFANGVIVDPGALVEESPLYDIEWLLPADPGVLLSAKAKQTTGFVVRVLAAGVPVETAETVGVPTSVATPCPDKRTKSVELPSTTRYSPATVHLGSGVWVAGWAPAKEWRGTCRLVTVPFADGTAQMLTIRIT